MGLFSKKKEPEQSNLQLEQVPSFQKLMETPPEPPPELSTAIPLYGFPPEPPGMATGRPPELSSVVPPPPAAAMQAPEMQAPESDFTKEDMSEFELPDFDDKELEALKKMGEPEAEEVEAEPDKVREWEAEPAAVMVLPPKSPDAKLELVPSPEPMPEAGARLQDEKFLELSYFFRLKEALAQAKAIARDTEEEMLAESYKARLAKISSFSSTVNAIQDRLMLIDGKLFEKPEVND